MLKPKKYLIVRETRARKDLRATQAVAKNVGLIRDAEKTDLQGKILTLRQELISAMSSFKT